MIVKIYTDRMAEIIVEEATEVPDAMDLVRAMTMNGINAAKIIRIQTAKKSRHRGLDQEGGGQSHNKGGQYGR